MLVGLDATPLLGRRTGIGRYVTELVRELARLSPTSGDELVATAFTVRGRGELSTLLPPGVTDRSRALPARLLQEVWARREWPAVTSLIGRVDVFHGTNFVLPPPGRARGVVTVHDLAFLHSPGTVSATSRRLQELVPRAVRRAAVVCTPSRAVAEEVVDAYGVPEDRIQVTPLGVDAAWAATPAPDAAWLAARGLPPRYVLFVGTLEPRKMLPTLIAAMRLLAGTEAGAVPLVLLGPPGWGPELDLAGLEGRVLTTGYREDDDVRGIVAGAAVLAFPSAAEGFGLPPLEAFATGVPVVASDLPVTREVLGDDSRRASLVPVGDEAALAEALAHRLGTPDPAGAAESRRAWAARFTWTATGAATVGAYRRAAGS
ncbi:MAG: putative Glycosyltransferase [Blastococcus sp.]|nr:putative Glycosyltransferase [Blastococcus sp.]